MAGGSKKRKRSKKVDNTDSNVDLTQINGYKCLPILKHIVTYSANDEGDDGKNPDSIVKIRSCIYFRRHFGKRLKQTHGDDNNNLVPGGTIEVENNQRNTIFVANLCQRMDETSIKTLFSIDDIQVADVGIGILDNNKAAPLVRYAHVTFETEDCVEKIMELKANSLIKNPLILNATNEGFERWLQDTIDSVPTLSSLRAEADEYMESFQQRLEDERKAMERRMQEADDDGFTVVKRSRQARRSGQNATNIAPRRGRKQKKSKELKDFYRFQLKEGKRDKLAELREQFEADKKKVEKLKQTKKFKGL
jgi:hypothetical protein